MGLWTLQPSSLGIVGRAGSLQATRKYDPPDRGGSRLRLVASKGRGG